MRRYGLSAETDVTCVIPNWILPAIEGRTWSNHNHAAVDFRSRSSPAASTCPYVILSTYTTKVLVADPGDASASAGA